MAGFDPTSLPIRPGIYTNFVKAAVDQIRGGVRGTVAIPLETYSGQAVAKRFYTIEREGDALILFGQSNIKPISLALQGGAKDVLVYAMPTIDDTTVTEAAAYMEARESFEAHPFNVFVFDGEITAAEQDAALAWCKTNRDEGKHFITVFGGNLVDDQDPTKGNARSVRLKDDYAVNLINGVIDGNGTEISSGDYAPYIAGLIAGTAINKAITYAEVPVSDVTKRLRNSEIKTALAAGSLVLVNDGEAIRVEQGLTTSASKIRIQRARQAISSDIAATARKSYIGKLDNNPAGQAALISAIRAYLETLEGNNVLMNPDVKLDPQFKSEGDKVFLAISYTEVDSMERIFLTINV